MNVIPTIRTASRDFYLAYLNTPDWRRRRNRALQLANWQCQHCAAKRDLEVHHKTYERLGAEWDDDLEVVCTTCHDGVHLDEMQASLAHRLYLSVARRALRANPLGSVPDLVDDVKRACTRFRIPYDPHQVDKALGLIIGELKPQQAHIGRQSAPVSTIRPSTHTEARAVLRRLEVGFELGLASLVKSMPAASPSSIDIYAPVLVERVDHDRY